LFASGDGQEEAITQKEKVWARSKSVDVPTQYHRTTGINYRIAGPVLVIHSHRIRSGIYRNGMKNNNNKNQRNRMESNEKKKAVYIYIRIDYIHVSFYSLPDCVVRDCMNQKGNQINTLQKRIWRRRRRMSIE